MSMMRESGIELRMSYFLHTELLVQMINRRFNLICFIQRVCYLVYLKTQKSLSIIILKMITVIQAIALTKHKNGNSSFKKFNSARIWFEAASSNPMLFVILESLV